MEESDDFVADLIIRKVKDSSVVVSFAEVAREAKARNRNRLAAQVLCNCLNGPYCNKYLKRVIHRRQNLIMRIFHSYFSYWITKCMPKIRCLC